MSDTMLLGVLRMPVEVHGDLALAQLVSRAQEAADRIEKDAERIAELEAEREALAAHVVTLLGALRLASKRISILAQTAVEHGATVSVALDVWPESIAKTITETPLTCLARRDAEVAHSVLSHAAAKAPPEVNTWLNALAEDYRGQAGRDRAGETVTGGVGVKVFNLWEIHNADSDSQWVPLDEVERMKAQWQAEALEDAAENASNAGDAYKLIESAAELRRQAEGE